MVEPVTIITGVTYDRKNIEKWLFTYRKKTCPATMQTLTDSHITPNHTLHRLILSWRQTAAATSSDQRQTDNRSAAAALADLIAAVDSSPFKVTALRNLRSIITADGAAAEAMRTELMASARSVDSLVRILVQILASDGTDFAAFRACEEALAVLRHLTSDGDGGGAAVAEALSRPESIRAMAVMLQRASGETRAHVAGILRDMARGTEVDWAGVLVRDQRLGSEVFKALLELVSDEIVSSNRASCLAVEVLMEILVKSKKSRIRAVEAGAVRVLVELLPDLNRSKSEKVLFLLKLLCECAEGRLGVAEHAMGIAAVSKKAVGVSAGATKVAVKVLWLLSSFHPTERVLEEMLVCGTVKKLVALLHMDGRSSTKDKVVNILKLHGHSWKKYPCFPIELRDYLGFVDRTNNNNVS